MIVLKAAFLAFISGEGDMVSLRSEEETGLLLATVVVRVCLD
tara:strand:+ start:544 stop:669 length:126 start_codon:yes stop_codon:yes gene_type:complete